MNEGMVKTYRAGAVIAPRRIIKHGSADREAIQASAAADALVGVADSLGAEAIGDPVDVIRSGIADVEYGGNVTRGALLTADADGKAIAAAPAAGANARIIGTAEVSGVAGDVGKVFISPGSLQG